MASILCTFTAAENTLLENYSAVGEATWAKNSAFSGGTCRITSGNRAYAPNATNSIYVVTNFTPASYDYDVSCSLYVASVPGSGSPTYGVSGRAGNSAYTGYYAVWMNAAGTWVLRLYRGGNGTPLGAYNTGNPSNEESHSLQLKMRGNVISVFWDGVERISATAEGANIINDVGLAGVYLNTDGVHLDNLTVADAVATGYSLTGPAYGAVSEESSDFTVTPNGPFTGTITPDDGAAGGTFDPASLTWSGTYEAKTCTYTPSATPGAKTISCTNDGGIADASPLSYQAYATTGVVAVPAGDLWGNGYDGISTPAQSPFARLVIDTDAAYLRITGHTDIYGSFPAWAQLGIRKNGVALTALTFGANGTADFEVSLGAGSKRLEVVTGLQSNPSSVLGTYIDSFELLGATSYSVKPAPSQARLCVYGDSIAVGDHATTPTVQGWPALLAQAHKRNTILEAWGMRSLKTDCADASARAVFVARLAAYAPYAIWLAIGTNDYGLNAWSAADFGTAYADLLDRLIVAIPGVRIYCQTPLQRIAPASEAANGSGSTLGDYRDQIATAVATRTTSCVLVDGAAIVSDVNMHTDGLHPAVAGHAQYAAFVDTALTPVFAALGGGRFPSY